METQKDQELQTVKQIVLQGWPEHKTKVSPLARPYWDCKHEISTEDGILFKGDKIIIPEIMRNEMLTLIHSSHLGTEKC